MITSSVDERFACDEHELRATRDGLYEVLRERSADLHVAETCSGEAGLHECERLIREARLRLEEAMTALRTK